MHRFIILLIAGFYSLNSSADVNQAAEGASHNIVTQIEEKLDTLEILAKTSKRLTGHSELGLEIYTYSFTLSPDSLTLISDRVAFTQNDPHRILMVFGQHADETVALMGLNLLLDFLEATSLDRHSQGSITLDIIPFANPDGLKEASRQNYLGKDLNRDFEVVTAHHDKSKRGQKNKEVKNPSKASETKAVVDQMSYVEYDFLFNMHSGMTPTALYPYGDREISSTDRVKFIQYGRFLAEYCHYNIMQSRDDYKTSGELIDYAFSKYGTVAYTLEVSTAKSLEDLKKDSSKLLMNRVIYPIFIQSFFASPNLIGLESEDPDIHMIKTH